MKIIINGKELVLDEPTAMLDPNGRKDVIRAARALNQVEEITIILITHYMEEAESLSDRIGIMKNGKLLAVGTVAELKKTAGVDDFESAFVSIVKGDAV